MEIEGWDVEVIDKMLQAGMYLPPEYWQYLNEVINSDEYQAYEAFREDNPDQAAKLEESDYTTNIEFGETNHPYQDSIVRGNDGEFTITINQNLMQADTFYQSGAILGASYDIAFPLSERDIQMFWAVPKMTAGAGLFIAGEVMVVGGIAGIPETLGASLSACYIGSGLMATGYDMFSSTFNALWEDANMPEFPFRLGPRNSPYMLRD